MNIYFQTLAGRELYRSGQLVIQQNFGYRWLSFQDDTRIQTLIHRRKPQRPAMPYLVPFTWALRKKPGSTCLLGMGGGAVIHMITPYLQQSSLLAVENSTEVITLSRQYFGLHSFSNLTIIHQEAQQFMQQLATQYEHILIDLHSDTGFPADCANLEFFLDCKRALHPNGFLALNMVSIEHEMPVFAQLKAAFPQTTLCIPVPHSSNMIVLATHAKADLLALVDTHPQLQTFIWDPMFGYMAKL